MTLESSSVRDLDNVRKLVEAIRRYKSEVGFNQRVPLFIPADVYRLYTEDIHAIAPESEFKIIQVKAKFV